MDVIIVIFMKRCWALEAKDVGKAQGWVIKIPTVGISADEAPAGQDVLIYPLIPLDRRPRHRRLESRVLYAVSMIKGDIEW